MKLKIKNFFVLFILLHKIGFSQTSELLFQKGNEFYNNGKYELAINEYNKIIDNNIHSSELYFNLGNSFYKLNKVAECNYYYEKALLLSPNNKEILDNLSFAKNMTLDIIEDLPQTQIQQRYNLVISYFSTKTWAFISLGLVLAFFITALFYLFSYDSRYKRVFFSLSIFFLFISVLTSSVVWNELTRLKEIKKGIIFSKELSVYSEPNKRNEEIFVLHEGTKVEILDSLKGWEKIRLANGSEGWVVEKKIKSL